MIQINVFWLPSEGVQWQDFLSQPVSELVRLDEVSYDYEAVCRKALATPGLLSGVNEVFS